MRILMCLRFQSCATAIRKAAIDALPADSVFTGFYSYGELAIGLSGQCELHNQTMTLTLISER